MESDTLLESAYKGSLKSQWGWVLATGILSLIFGIITIAVPGAAYETLVWAYFLFAFLSGLVALCYGIFGGKSDFRGYFICFGILGVLAGILVMFLPPAVVTFSSIIFIGVWALVGGIAYAIEVIVIHKRLPAWGWHLFSAIISILFGILVIYEPLMNMVFISIWISVAAIVWGIVEIILSFRLKNL